MNSATTAAVQVGEIPMVGGGTPTPVAAFFQGYDTFGGSARSTAVRGTLSPARASSQMSYSVCYDSESLSQSLRVSASAGVSTAFGSADAKATFARKLNVTTTTVSIVVYCSVEQTQAYTSVALDPGVSVGDVGRFFRVYGDAFVSSLVTGAEYIAVYSFYTQSVEEQESLTATLSAHGIYSGGQVSASLQSALDSVQKEVSVRKNMQQIITGVSSPTYPGSSGIIEYALRFGSLQHDAPAVIAYGTTGYEHVPDMPDLGAIPGNRGLIEESDGSAGSVARQLAALQGVANQIAWLNDGQSGVYHTYGYTEDHALQERSAANQADLGTVRALIATLASEPTRSYARPALPSLANGTPVLGFSLAYGPQMGGNGGGPFQDFTPDMIAQQVRPSTLVVRGGRWVDAFKPGYLSPSGPQSYHHGGNGGSDSTTLSLQAGEFVTGVWGSWGGGGQGTYMDQLRFTTSRGNVLQWPSKPDKAKHSLDWKVPAGQVLVGFQGRCGKYLDQLQPVTLVLGPARWVALPSSLLG